MNIKFMTNDYMLAWEILFQASISEEMHKVKEKLWTNYKKIYGKMANDNQIIIKENKNFIPDDDTLYNLLFNHPLFTILRKDTEKYRQYLLSVWDKNKKQIQDLIKKVLRIDIKNYQILVVNPLLDRMAIVDDPTNKRKVVIWGRKKDYDNPTSFIVDLIYKIVEMETKDRSKDIKNKDIVKAIVEMATLNEIPTLLQNKSYYLDGTVSLKQVKKQVYPYWLMYLGADKEDMLSFMMRDKIAFDVDKYVIEKRLKQLDLYSFIDFCCRNQKYIVKIEEAEII